MQQHASPSRLDASKSSCAIGLDLGLAFPTTCVSVEAGITSEELDNPTCAAFVRESQHGRCFNGSRRAFDIPHRRRRRPPTEDSQLDHSYRIRTLRRYLAFDDNPGYQSSHLISKHLACPWILRCLFIRWHGSVSVHCCRAKAPCCENGTVR